MGEPALWRLKVRHYEVDSYGHVNHANYAHYFETARIGLWFAGSGSDRWGRVRVFVPGLVAYAALLGSLPLVTHPMVLGLWSFAIGAAAGCVAGLPTALIGDRVAPPLTGVAIGWLRTMTDAGHILGPVVMGALADAMHLSAPFVFAAVLLMTIALWCRRDAAAPSAST